MTVMQLRELADADAQVVPLTVEQYHRMIEGGILVEGAPIELIDGLLVRKDRSKAGEGPMTIGLEHIWVVDQLNDLNPRLRPIGCFLRVQQPIALPPDNEPEPDGVILRGTSADYRHRLAQAADVICVFEISDSSLNYDRTTKYRIYAAAGIATYILVNLVNRVVEVYEQPDAAQRVFASKRILSQGDALAISMPEGPALQISVASILH